MKNIFFLVALWFFQAWMAEAIVLDRVLAVVNGEIISLSDVENELIFFGEVKPVPEKGFSDSDIQAGIQRLIDHKLLLAEAKRFDVENPNSKQIQEKLEEIQKRFSTPGDFEKALRQNAMTLEDLKQKIAEHLIVDRFIDQRIRFFAIVLPEEIAGYYAEHQADFQGKPLEEVEKDIERILLEQKEKAKLEDYLRILKNKASIQINF
jgi:peptidyl-prolyl cis-trans isomerase SurA